MRTAMVLVIAMCGCRHNDAAQVLDYPAPETVRPIDVRPEPARMWWCTSAINAGISSCHGFVANCDDMRRKMIEHGTAMSDCHASASVFCYSTSTPEGLSLDTCSETMSSCEFLQRPDPRVFKTCAQR